VGLTMSCFTELRLLDPYELGLLPLISLIAVAKACDTGAYTFGRLFGRHKMSPIISPGKTIEGAVGGLLAACAASYAVFWPYTVAFLSGHDEPKRFGGAWGWLAFGLLVGAAGMFGDLAESMLKRDAGVKDSSTWLPGLGGVLDILDSLLLSAPIALGWWLAATGQVSWSILSSFGLWS
ncbi:MAG: phosphatidate cytidylyltransferase, partial [Pirellulales bacterium]